MFQVTMTTSTSPPVTVGCCGASFITVMVMLVPTSVGQIKSGQHGVVLPPQLILRDTLMGFACFTNLLQHQPPQSQMPSQVYANYAMGPLQVRFSFRAEPSLGLLCHVLVSVMVVAFCFQVLLWLPCSLWGINHWGLKHCNPSGFTLGRHMCLLVLVSGPCQKCTEWLLLLLPQVGGVLIVSQPFQQ